MLLRRVIDHVKTQNWMAVVLDFFIVVLGVFMGIQVSNWNAARVERQLEHQALNQLLAESERASGYFEWIIYYAEQLRVDREAAEAKLRGVPFASGNPERGLAIMSFYRQMTPLQATYDQLTASGDITLIQSQEIRQAMSFYYGFLNFHDINRQESVDHAPDIFSLATAHINIHYDKEETLGFSLEVDWESAGKDAVLMNAIHRVMGEQVAFHQHRKDVLERSLEMCRLIASAVESECSPADISVFEG